MRDIGWIDDPYLREHMKQWYLMRFGYYLENGVRHEH